MLRRLRKKIGIDVIAKPVEEVATQETPAEDTVKTEKTEAPETAKAESKEKK